MKRILMIVGDYVEDYELIVPFQALQVCGYEVIAAAPGLDKGDKIHTAIHDNFGAMTYAEKPGHNFRLNGDFRDARAKSYDALVIPGGRSPEYLCVDGRVIDVVHDFYEAGKPIAALCHGPMVLAAADIIQGIKISAYKGVQPMIELAGGIYIELGKHDALTDGKFVTAASWPAHPEYLRQLLKLLK